MKIRIMDRKDFTTTAWQGGETTELFIWPKGAVLADRDFKFRISSAVFTGTRSSFSDFSGYQRFILPLQGTLKLTHEGLYQRELAKNEAEYFDGSWSTLCENSLDCRDYNFIVRSDSTALLQILNQGASFECQGKTILTAYSVEPFTLDTEGDGKRSQSGDTLYVLETENGAKVTIAEATSPVILTVFNEPCNKKDGTDGPAPL